MQQLLLDVSTESYQTDRITGKPVVDSDNKPVRIAQDTISGDWYKKIAEVIPSDDDPKSKAKAAKIAEQNPQQARNTPGYWVKLDGYNPVLTEAEVAAAKAAVAK